MWGKQDSITVECVLPAWKPYMLQFQWFPNEQVWTGLHHQMSLAVGPRSAAQERVPYLTFPRGWGTVPCDLSHDAFDVTPLGTDRHLWKDHLSAKVFAGGKNGSRSPSLNCQSANRMLLWQSRSRSSLLCFPKISLLIRTVSHTSE